jgi:hypothetical protein
MITLIKYDKFIYKYLADKFFYIKIQYKITIYNLYLFHINILSRY